jgi:hypothetical protein
MVWFQHVGNACMQTHVVSTTFQEACMQGQSDCAGPLHSLRHTRYYLPWSGRCWGGERNP